MPFGLAINEMFNLTDKTKLMTTVLLMTEYFGAKILQTILSRQVYSSHDTDSVK